MSDRCTIQDIFNQFYPSYELSHKLSAVQRKTAYSIMNCKTGAFGVNISVCEECSTVTIHHNSCRNRCCPMCQEFPKEKWVDARKEDVLDAPYFHVVFTVPEELNPVIYNNQKPIRVISRVFRGKYLMELKQLWTDQKLEFHGTSQKYQNHYAFKELLDICYGKEWSPYCKKTFQGAQAVIQYLGKYTHRIAVSNHRIIHMDEKSVTFAVKDYNNAGQWKELTVSGEEFIRRFLMHVPPKRFVRIRHYGMLSNKNKLKKLTLCRNLLGCKKYISRLKSLDAAAMIKLIYQVDVCKCNACGGHLVPASAAYACGRRSDGPMRC